MHLQNIPLLFSKDCAEKVENNLSQAFQAKLSARSSAGWSQHAAQSGLQNGNFRSKPDEETEPVCVTLHKLPLWQARGKYRHTPQPWLRGELKQICTNLISCFCGFYSFLKAEQTLLVDWFISNLLSQADSCGLGHKPEQTLTHLQHRVFSAIRLWGTAERALVWGTCWIPKVSVQTISVSDHERHESDGEDSEAEEEA